MISLAAERSRFKKINKKLNAYGHDPDNSGTDLCQWPQDDATSRQDISALFTERLGLQPQGEDTGSAVVLAPQILQVVGSAEKPVLLPCGNLRRETIPTALAEAGVSVNSITVYETIPNPAIRDQLEEIARRLEVPEFFVYFSPSGIKFTHGTLMQLNFPLDRLKRLSRESLMSDKLHAVVDMGGTRLAEPSPT
ncbi:hypothetical protein NP493_58g01005 [Ridgeia piscesae]|uniref:Tetrapyrrole biosynthesis uroporphyrinogen III synthase domain-containing protein n=1 Tax=Ridgeia piscesae TaxID=27915 RepID=A0AAD9PAH5_RIDPI|nr:hypothetical protein NP493_58g01005 [Ridgeia piscesae]